MRGFYKRTFQHHHIGEGFNFASGKRGFSAFIVLLVLAVLFSTWSIGGGGGVSLLKVDNSSLCPPILPPHCSYLGACICSCAPLWRVYWPSPLSSWWQLSVSSSESAWSYEFDLSGFQQSVSDDGWVLEVSTQLRLACELYLGGFRQFLRRVLITGVRGHYRGVSRWGDGSVRAQEVRVQCREVLRREVCLSRAPGIFHKEQVLWEVLCSWTFENEAWRML